MEVEVRKFGSNRKWIDPCTVRGFIFEADHQLQQSAPEQDTTHFLPLVVLGSTLRWKLLCTYPEAPVSQPLIRVNGSLSSCSSHFQWTQIDKARVSIKPPVLPLLNHDNGGISLSSAIYSIPSAKVDLTSI
jgi:hypothetical protein